MRSSEKIGLHCYIAPLGIPAVIRAHDPVLASAAAAAYADWKVGPPFAEPRITLTLDRAEPSSKGVDAVIRVEGSVLTIESAEIMGHADARTMRASCNVPSRLIDDPRTLAAEALDPLLLFLLSRCDRTPLHAAGILIRDQALVLAGRSGSGKSSLALAAARRGLPVLSEDIIYAQSDPRQRLWGFHRSIHVFPQDAPPGPHPTRLRAGKLKAVLPMPHFPDGIPVAENGCLILLRHGREPALTRLETAEATRSLPPLDPGFDLLPGESADVMRTLIANGAWRLTLSADPDAAIDLLCRHFDPVVAAG